MVDSDIIAQRMERLKTCVKQLRAIQKLGKKKVCGDPVIFAAMERYLQLSVECVLGVGNHIIAGLNLRKPSTYEQITQILCEEKVISKKAYNIAKPVAFLRTMLVHDCSPLGREKTFDTAKDTLPAFEELAKAYQKFL